MVKINYDSEKGRENEWVIAVVCRQSDEHVWWAGRQVIHGNWSALEAEGRACMWAVEMTSKKNHQRVLIESDCRELVCKIKSHETIRSMIGFIIEQIWSLSKNVSHMDWVYTPQTVRSYIFLWRFQHERNEDCSVLTLSNSES